jgi:ribosomal protein S18 acetylase RimI-like enzyme
VTVIPCPSLLVRRRPQSSSHYHSCLAVEQVAIRAGQIEDLPRVLDLWKQARSEHATTPDRLEDLERLVLGSPGALLLAEANGLALGVLIAAWDGWRGNLYRLAVHPEHRRSGVGLRLVRAGEAHLRRQGAVRVTALVAYDDPVAAAFWDGAGYPRDPDIGRRVCAI